MQELISTSLPGMAAMANVHPLFVHFPIALLSAFIVMEILGVVFRRDQLRTAATWMLYLGTLGAAAAVIAGFIGAAKVPHSEEVHKILKWHELLGSTVLALAVFLSAWRTIAGAGFSAVAQAVHILIGIIMVTVMTFGADLGGLMVYKYGVATEVAEVEEGEAPGHAHGDEGRQAPHTH
jgi:uncharacterized membrane protein